MATSYVAPDDLVDHLEELLMGRNIAPSTMYEKYVVSVKKEADALLLEVDDGSIYRVSIAKIS